MESKRERIKKWFKDNKKSILTFVVGIFVGVGAMAFFWPERIAKLEDGTESIVTIDGKTFTADDLYVELRDNGGIDAILNLIDTHILNEKYDLDEEAAEYASEQAVSIYEMYETNYGYTKEEFLSSNNFDSEEDFLNYLKEEFLFQEYYQEYLASLVDDKEAKEYYEDTVDGKKNVYIFSATTEENDLKKVKSALEKGKSAEDIQKDYPDVIFNDLGEIDFTTYANYSDEFLKQLKKLDKKEASSVFSDDAFGYAVIYVTDAEEKKEYDEIKEDILNTIGQNKALEDESLYYKGFIKLRDDYNIKFYDTSLKKSYEDLKKQYK